MAHPQSRTVTIDFAVGERVQIKELSRPGVVLAVYLSETGIKYAARYFFNGEAKEVYFYEWELESNEAERRTT